MARLISGTFEVGSSDTDKIVLDPATNSLTLSGNTSFNVNPTWNDANTVYTAVKSNVTNTNSAASSLLMDLQVGGTSKFKVDKTGGFTAGRSVYLDNSTVCQIINHNDSPLFASYQIGGVSNCGALYLKSTAVRALSVGATTLRADNFLWDCGISFSTGSDADLAIGRDAANTLAQRNSTNAQESRVYATYTSASNYQRCSIKTGKTTLANVAGANVTATNLIPAGAFLIGVTSRINTALGTSNGTTGYSVGTVDDIDLWGSAANTAIGVALGSANYTSTGASGLFIANTNVIVTAQGGNFDGTGAIELAIHYMLTEAD